MRDTRLFLRNLRKTLCIAMALIGSGCSSSRNLTYFNDLPNDSVFQTAIVKAHEPRIQPGDVLSITVSSLDPVTNAMFNTGTVDAGMESDVLAPRGNIEQGAPAIGRQGYLVDKDGYIDFPVIGSVHLADKTRAEAHDLMLAEISKYTKDPIVTIRYLNFKITVIGEVNRPGTFTVNNERISVLEALGLAGDMTVYGQRNNVLLIRETGGKRMMYRMDLNKKEVFNSPYFYLHQNDVVYVEPKPLKDPSGEKGLRIVTATAAVATAISVIIFRIF